MKHRFPSILEKHRLQGHVIPGHRPDRTWRTSQGNDEGLMNMAQKLIQEIELPSKEKDGCKASSTHCSIE
eukprot:9020901-Prorocentrum_lima.AAC.1